MGETYSKPVKEPYPTTLVIKKKRSIHFLILLFLLLLSLLLSKKSKFPETKSKIHEN